MANALLFCRSCLLVSLNSTSGIRQSIVLLKILHQLCHHFHLRISRASVDGQRQLLQQLRKGNIYNCLNKIIHENLFLNESLFLLFFNFFIIIFLFTHTRQIKFTVGGEKKK